MPPILQPGQEPEHDDQFEPSPGVGASFRSLGFTAGRKARPQLPRTARSLPWLTTTLAGVTLGALASGWALWHTPGRDPHRSLPPFLAERPWWVLPRFEGRRPWLEPTRTTILIVRDRSSMPTVPPDFVGPPPPPREMTLVSRVKVLYDPRVPLPTRLGDLSQASTGHP